MFFLELVAAEVARAEAHNKPMNSHHEAYAVILEELDEYWQEVKNKPHTRNETAMLEELVQIAAMCARTAKDLLNTH